MLHVTPSIPSLSSKDVKYICARLPSLSSDKTEQPRRAYAEAMASLRAHHAHAVLDALSGLGPQQQMQCIRMCGATLPHLASDVSHYVATGSVAISAGAAAAAPPSRVPVFESAPQAPRGRVQVERGDTYDDWVHGQQLEQARPAACDAPVASPAREEAHREEAHREEAHHEEAHHEEEEDGGVQALVRTLIDGNGAEASEAAGRLSLLLCPSPGGGAGDAQLRREWCVHVVSAASHRLKHTGLDGGSGEDDMCLAPAATLMRCGSCVCVCLCACV